jgi:methionyl-tRNA formyltransferase
VLRSVFVYGANGAGIEALTQAAVRRAGLESAWSADRADLALAPLLRRKLTRAEWTAPALGTLIFHPSLLPRYRGPDAVKWARDDAFTGATWFWCDDGLDTGDICEQELVAIPSDALPREIYERAIVPAGIRALERALEQMQRGYVRRVPQDHAAATYQSWHPTSRRARAS